MNSVRDTGLRGCLAVALAAGGCTSEPPFTDAGLVVRPDVLPSAPGAPCEVDLAGEASRGCSAGQLCLTARQGFPGGYCAPECLRTPCPASGRCFPVGGGTRYCVLRCVSDADCRVREGYTCRLAAPGATPVCLPNDAPTGHRDDGRACYATGEGGDAGTGPFLAPLPRVSFAAPEQSASRGRVATLTEAQASIAADPGPRGGAVVSFTGIDPRGYWRGGLTRVGPDGVPRGTLEVQDHAFPDLLQPAVAFDRAARLHVGFIGDNPDRPGNVVRYAYSDDGGATLSAARTMFTGDDCVGGCLAQSLAVGPAAGGAGDAVYSAAIVLSNGDRTVRFTRAPAADAVFAPAVVVAQAENTLDGQLAPVVAAVAGGLEPGTVAVTWVSTTVDNGLAALGDVHNRVRLRLSRDGGASFGPAVEVARAGDAPVPQPPQVGFGPGVVHVAYVHGGLLGAWDVVLATSTDGGAHFAYRVVNDDPDRCATHAFAGLAVDAPTGDAHVLFLDNRYGGGEAVYARCPADPTARCGRNEAVSSAAFFFSTSQDPTRWHGTYSGLARGPGGATWAAWSDTRTGGPGIYVARGGP